MQSMVNKINEVRRGLGLSIFKIGLVFALLLVLGACVSNPTNRTNLADLYDNTMDAYERKEYLTAEHGLQMLSTRVPQDTLVWFRLGNIYARTDRPALAIKAYEEALLRDPSKAKPWHNKGMIELYIAMFTFSDMLISINEDDPFYARAVHLQSAIAALIEDDFQVLPPANRPCLPGKRDDIVPQTEPQHQVLIPEEEIVQKLDCAEQRIDYAPLPLSNKASLEPEAKTDIGGSALDSTESIEQHTEVMESQDKPGGLILKTMGLSSLGMENDESEQSPVASIEINFDFAQSTVNPTAEAMLQAASSKFMSARHLQIRGVTGNDGRAEYHQKLAAQRAENVRNYLIQLGVEVDRIEILDWDPSIPGFKVVITAYQ